MEHEALWFPCLENPETLRLRSAGYETAPPVTDFVLECAAGVCDEDHLQSQMTFAARS